MSIINLSNNDVVEFKIEAEELLDSAENALLNIEKGGDFLKNFEAIFRAFHSVKGAAGMLNWVDLQNHMHKLEGHFQSCKSETTLAKPRVTYFLNGIDGSRKILNQESIEFRYELPGVQASEPEAVQGRDSEVVSAVVSKSEVKNSLKKIPILVLDDEANIVEILSEILEGGGFAVHGFTDAKQALACVGEIKPYMVFSDISMPGLSGLDVLHAINKIDADLPLVFVSAHISKSVLIESISYGVFGAIEKPFNIEQILAMARNASRRYQLWLLLNRSVNFVLYQFSALHEYLEEKGMVEVRSMMVKEMQSLLEIRRELREAKESNLNSDTNSDANAINNSNSIYKVS